MKTPMQEFFDRIEKFHGNNWIPKKEKETYLEKEKQVVVDAHNIGWEEGFTADPKRHTQTGDEYYNETFKI